MNLQKPTINIINNEKNCKLTYILFYWRLTYRKSKEFKNIIRKRQWIFFSGLRIIFYYILKNEFLFLWISWVVLLNTNFFFKVLSHLKGYSLGFTLRSTETYKLKYRALFIILAFWKWCQISDARNLWQVGLFLSYT